MAFGTHRMIFPIGEPAYAVDRDGTIVAWNGAASSEFGHSRSQAVGRKCWELLHGQDTFSRFTICLRRNQKKWLIRPIHHPPNAGRRVS